ncbi:MAG TPA: hypothetical protein VLZ07_07365, partial [Syntrophales bacterium]|nr:hypothetical protein [Syntrophales bacterium]
VPDMLFRPEEIHGASRVACIFKPLPERNGHVGRVFFCFIGKKRSIADDHFERCAAIQAGKIYLHCLTGE